MLVILKAAMGAENGVLAAAHGVGVGDVVDDIHDFLLGEGDEPLSIGAQDAHFEHHLDGGPPQPIEEVVVTGDHLGRVIGDAPLLGDGLELGPVDLSIEILCKTDGTCVRSGPKFDDLAAAAYQHDVSSLLQGLGNIGLKPPFRPRASSLGRRLPRRPC